MGQICTQKVAHSPSNLRRLSSCLTCRMALTSSSVHFLRVSNCSRPCSFCPRRDVSKSRTNIRACNDTGGSLMSLLCNPEANLHCCNEGNTIFTSLLPCANCRAHLSSRQTMRPQHSRARHSTTQHSVTHMTGLLFQKLQSPTRQQLRRLAQTADPDGAGGCQGVEGSRHAVNQLFSFCRCLRHVLLPFKLHQTYKARHGLGSRELLVYARPCLHARLQCIIMIAARGCGQALM